MHPTNASPLPTADEPELHLRPAQTNGHRPLAPPAPTVSVVVPAHRDGPAWQRCLRSLRALDPPPHELLAVVDGDDPRVTVPVGIRRLGLAHRSGPAAARNRGAEHATGDVLLFVDSEARRSRSPPPGARCSGVACSSAARGPAASAGRRGADGQPGRRPGACAGAVRHPVPDPGDAGGRAPERDPVAPAPVGRP